MTTTSNETGNTSVGGPPRVNNQEKNGDQGDNGKGQDADVRDGLDNAADSRSKGHPNPGNQGTGTRVRGSGVLDTLTAPAFLSLMLALVKEYGLRSLSLTAQCFLERLSRGSATMTELARCADVSVSAVSPQLAALTRLRMVEKLESEAGDRREKVWRITDDGLELLTNYAIKKNKGNQSPDQPA